MKLRSLLTLCLLTAGGMSAMSQVNNDITDVYLKNAGFDSNYNYGVGETGNVAQQIMEVEGWTKDIVVDYTITGVYQLGTRKTFNGAPVPSRGYEGTSNGGVLALSTGWNQSLKYYQRVTLPAGTYSIVTAFYNCTSTTTGRPLVGWLPTEGTGIMSKKTSFPANAWITDTVTFTLTKTTVGKIQIGYFASQNAGSGSHAKVVLDFVKLLRDHPLDASDVAIYKVDLLQQLTTAKSLYADGSGNDAAQLKGVIDAAQAVYDDTNTTIERVTQLIADLTAAIDAYQCANPTGDVPVVVTDKRFARGATMAFGRMTAMGTDIIERGFCWSTNPNPTIKDHKTTEYISHKGYIYWLKDLMPSTQYYIRAYAVSKGKQVGYGEVLKIYTLRKGSLSYTMRSGGDADACARIDAAMKDAVNWWNNLTSIQGVNFNVGHNPGTPTADCSYGGYIRVGSNISYQRTGTMLHEMAHGVGIGTHDPYWNPEMRANGDRGVWLGDRVTEVIRFWEDSPTATVTGDNVHFWPYGINGAHEDNGSDALYIIHALLIQAFGEDGLPPSGGFASPSYQLNQETDVKYYIKNESADYGLYTSYVTELSDNTVTWQEMSRAEALVNDRAAWYVSFNPINSLYIFQNVSTGHYLTFKTATASMSTTNRTNPISNDFFQLMRGRVNALDNSNLRGYWVVSPSATLTPFCMQAKVNSGIGMGKYDLSNNARSQRWLILTQEQLTDFEQASKDVYAKDLKTIIEQIKTLRSVPHTEDIAGVDQTLNNKITTIEAQAAAPTITVEQLISLIDEARIAGFNFLANATPSSNTRPFDLTFMIINAGMDELNGWSGSPALNYSSAEYYQSTFDFNQIIRHLPAGSYQLKVQAFQRPGSSTESYADYIAGKDKVTTYLYAGNKSIKVKNAIAEAQITKVEIGSESSLPFTPIRFIPNDMQSASAYFGKGLYDNGVFTDVVNDGDNLPIGLRCIESGNMYWSIFDNFRLYYYGNQVSGVVAGIHELRTDKSTDNNDVYSISGRLVRKNATNLKGLPKGIYIMNGKKVVVER